MRDTFTPALAPALTLSQYQHHHFSSYIIHSQRPTINQSGSSAMVAWRSGRNPLLLIVDLSQTHPGRSEVRIVIRTMFFSSRYNVKGSAVLFAIFEGILPSLCLYLHAPLYSRSATATVVCACR